MARREWADRVEKVAKTLFDLTHSVSDIHEYGWPGWASECAKRDYRAIAEWHLRRLDRAKRTKGRA